MLARLVGTELIRLQCYEGLDVQTALYEWDYPRQMLRLRIADGRGEDATALEARLFSREYLLERPLLRAITHRDGPAVLLIDEIDRADDGFEAFLLEVLSDFQVTIPELGTIKAEHPPYVRADLEPHARARRRASPALSLSLPRPPDASSARCASSARAAPTRAARCPSRSRASCRRLRARSLVKPPGVAETLDFTRALRMLHQDSLDAEVVSQTLGCLLKDRARSGGVLARRRGGAGGFVARGAVMIDGATPCFPRGVTGDLAPALARFGGTLRAHGIAATVRDEIDAIQALGLVDRDDRDEVRTALRIALKIPREAWTAYDRLFAAFWTGADLIEPPDLPPHRRRASAASRRACCRGIPCAAA